MYGAQCSPQADTYRWTNELMDATKHIASRHTCTVDNQGP